MISGPIALFGAGFGFFVSFVLGFLASDRRIVLGGGLGAGYRGGGAFAAF